MAERQITLESDTKNQTIKQQTMRSSLLPLTASQRRFIITFGLVVGDALTIAAAFWLAYVVRFNILNYPIPKSPQYYARLCLILLPIWMVIFWLYQLYSTKILFGGFEEYERIFNAVTVGTGFLIFIDSMINREGIVSRGWLLIFWFLLIILMEVFRFSFRRFIYWLRKRGHFLSAAVVVGANPEGAALYQQLKNWHQSGLSIIGFVDDQTPVDEIVLEDKRVVGKIGDLEKLVQEKNVTEVIVASGSLRRNQLLDIYRLVSWKPNVTLRLSSGLYEIISTGLHIKELASVPLIEVNKTRITGLDAMNKRIIDLFIATISFFILWPFFLLIAILIKLDSAGPVFYVHRVIGLNGTQFGAIKFRTMYHHSDHMIRSDENLDEQFHLNFKLKDDPRVTRLGRFLRRNSLDELPQLINVIRGEMSIVGPRFICMDEVKKYGKWHMNLLTIKPGMTGLWQVSGRSDVSYEERVRMDMTYIRDWSIWLDLYVMFATFPAVLKRRGAY